MKKKMSFSKMVMAFGLTTVLLGACQKAQYEKVTEQPKATAGPVLTAAQSNPTFLSRRIEPMGHVQLTQSPTLPLNGSIRPASQKNSALDGPNVQKVTYDLTEPKKPVRAKLDGNANVGCGQPCAPVQTPAVQPCGAPVNSPCVAAPPVAITQPCVNPDPCAAPPTPVVAPPVRREVRIEQTCPKCFHGQYNQEDELPPQKLDLLFVADTSASIHNKREKIANEIDSFIDGLPQQMDINIGVMWGQAKLAGELISQDGDRALMNTLSDDRGALRAQLYKKLAQAPQERESNGGELGVYSLYKGITDKLDKNQQLGFFRTDAALAVVFISDENDICTWTEPPPGVTLRPDVDHLEIPAAKKYCQGIKYKNVYERLLQVKRKSGGQNISSPVLVSGIIFTNDATIPRPTSDRYAQENEVGYGYLKMIELNAGKAIDLANDDIASGLREISQAMVRKLKFKTEFSLTGTKYPLEPQTLCVLKDGKEVFDYDLIEERNEVHVPGAAESGARIEFWYCEKNFEMHEPGNPNRYLLPFDFRIPQQIDPRCGSILEKQRKYLAEHPQ